MWGVELTEFKLLPDLLPTAHNETKRFNSGGRSYAPNHPADRLRGTSRHHYLGGGLDERRRPTRLAGAPASQGSCRSLGRRGLEASHRGFQIPPICRRHYCGAFGCSLIISPSLRSERSLASIVYSSQNVLRTEELCPCSATFCPSPSRARIATQIATQLFATGWQFQGRAGMTEPICAINSTPDGMLESPPSITRRSPAFG